ncbi:hypothetical protein Lal_00047910 [Lupinus albus]|nr:hypothetical protein Lal_00047910 [Lupinus albus]
MDSIEIITSLSMHPVTSNNLITSPVPPYKAHHYGVGLGLFVYAPSLSHRTTGSLDELPPSDVTK